MVWWMRILVALLIILAWTVVYTSIDSLIGVKRDHSGPMWMRVWIQLSGCVGPFLGVWAAGLIRLNFN